MSQATYLAVERPADERDFIKLLYEKVHELEATRGICKRLASGPLGRIV